MSETVIGSKNLEAIRHMRADVEGNCIPPRISTACSTHAQRLQDTGQTRAALRARNLSRTAKAPAYYTNNSSCSHVEKPATVQEKW